MKRPLFSLLVFVFLVTAAACAPAATEAPKTWSTDGEPAEFRPPATLVPGEIVLQIIRQDGSTQPIAAEAYNALPVRQIVYDNRTEEGPRLLDVLTIAGVTEFSEVTLANAEAATVLTRDQVDDNTLLVLSDHGALKLVSTHIRRYSWLRDLTTITVK